MEWICGMSIFNSRVSKRAQRTLVGEGRYKLQSELRVSAYLAQAKHRAIVPARDVEFDGANSIATIRARACEWRESLGSSFRQRRFNERRVRLIVRS